MGWRRGVDSRGGRGGAAAVEMAIVAPFLIFMFVVALDYCRVYYAVQIVNNAARCGALYASGTASAANGLTPLQAAQQAALADAVSLNPPLQPANVTLTTSTTSATVVVTYPFQTVCSYPGLPSPLILRGTVTMPLSSGTSQ